MAQNTVNTIIQTPMIHKELHLPTTGFKVGYIIWNIDSIHCDPKYYIH
jgi:hypothetical protein